MSTPANQVDETKPESTPRRRTRLIVLLFLAAIVGVGVFSFIEFRLKRPMGTGPAGPVVDASAFAQVWTEIPVQVIGVGDSITAGLGARSPRHSSYRRILRTPADEFESMKGVCLTEVLPDLQSENFAVSGSDSSFHENRITDSIPVYPDRYGVVLMTSGGNDLIHNYGRTAPRECAMYGATMAQAEPWIEAFGKRLNRMFDLLAARFPRGCEIYIADIYDPTDSVGDAPSIFLPDWPDGLAIHARYNQVIREVTAARDNVHVVPLYENFLGHGSHCRQFYRKTYDADDPHYWFYSNVEDPNDRGYDAIRRIYLNTILKNTKLRDGLNAY